MGDIAGIVDDIPRIGGDIPRIWDDIPEIWGDILGIWGDIPASSWPSVIPNPTGRIDPQVWVKIKFKRKKQSMKIEKNNPTLHLLLQTQNSFSSEICSCCDAHENSLTEPFALIYFGILAAAGWTAGFRRDKDGKEEQGGVTGSEGTLHRERGQHFLSFRTVQEGTVPNNAQLY